MNTHHFIFSDEQLELAEHLSKFLGAEISMDDVRDVFDSDTPYLTKTWQQMAQQGWLGLLCDDELGGSGLGMLDVCLLGIEFGKTLAPLPFFSHVCLASQAISTLASSAIQKEYLPKLAAGSLLATMAYRESGQSDWRATPNAIVTNGLLTGKKNAVPYGAESDIAIIYARDTDKNETALYLVDLHSNTINKSTENTLDLASSYASLEFNNTAALRLNDTGLSQQAFEDIINKAIIVNSFIQFGKTEAVLKVAHHYALERYAFGRQIGSFQAIKHKIARMYESRTIAQANCHFGAWAIQQNSPLLSLAAASAHIASSESFTHCAKENIKVHGGISATWEHDCHIYYRQAKVDALALGNSLTWNRLLTENLIANKQNMSIDFSSSPDVDDEHQILRQEIKQWIKENRPAMADVSKLSEKETFDFVLNWHKKKAEAGWACLRWPKEYGGKGWTHDKIAIWNEEEGEALRDMSFALSIIDIAGPVIMTCGSDEQKQRYLPKMYSGEEYWCMLFSEPHAGSDVAALRTKAVKDGNDWIINGQKVWTSHGHNSDVGLLIARTDPTVAKHRGLTYFLIDMHTPGIEVRQLKQITGNSEFCEVFFDDVRIPDSCRLGAINGGWPIVMTSLANEKVALRLFQIHLQKFLDIISDVSINGNKAYQDSLVQEKTKQFSLKSFASKFIELQSMHSLINKQQPGNEESITKLIVAATNLELASFVMDLYDEHCFESNTIKLDIIKFFEYIYLHFVGVSMGGGTDEILLNLIGDSLGLPPEPRVDKNRPFNELPMGV